MKISSKIFTIITILYVCFPCNISARESPMHTDISILENGYEVSALFHFFPKIYIGAQATHFSGSESETNYDSNILGASAGVQIRPLRRYITSMFIHATFPILSQSEISSESESFDEFGVNGLQVAIKGCIKEAYCLGISYGEYTVYWTKKNVDPPPEVNAIIPYSKTEYTRGIRAGYFF